MSYRRLLGLLAATLLAAPAFAQAKTDAAPAADAGVLVVAVQPGSPAQTAGIQRGDILLEANGTALGDAASLRQAIGSAKSGDTLTLKLRHGDALKTLSVTVGSRDGRPWVGIMPLPGRPDEFAGGPGGPGGPGMRGFGMMFPMEGALVEGVTPNSPADKAGLKKGDLILSVDGTTVDERNALSDLVAARKVGDTVTLSVSSWGQRDTRDVKVTLAKSPDKDAAWLGLQYLAAPARFAGPGMLNGALVVDVTADGPAAKAGITARDVVTKIDGKDIGGPAEVVAAVSAHKPGDALTLTVIHRP
ncbi:MAG TPA: PDZ domain-containing protein, partial [bacterium]|nr:PDZ domain-containing protein [bacterium]